MKKTILSFLISISLFLLSCDSVKRGLTGQKQVSSEEFLVKKKDPLVFPPKWSELPKPSGQVNNEDTEEEIIEKIFKRKQQDSKENSNSNNTGSTESLILKKILNR